MRISRELMFMEIASIVAKRSTCFRLNVGAIVVVNNRISSIGYNGQPAGADHCTELCDPGGCSTIHAEINALTYFYGAIRAGLPQMYVTDSPCMDCAIEIIRSGITKLYYRTPYRDLSPLSYMYARGVDIARVTPSGAIIPHETVPSAFRRGTVDEDAQA